MIFAVPILIAAALFLCWALISLTIAALPLFSGVSMAALVLDEGGSLGIAILTGVLVAVAVAKVGPFAFSRAGSPWARLAIGFAFAAPAALAAHHAAAGLLGHLVGIAARQILAVLVAIVVAMVAWRRLAEDARRA